MILAVTDVSRSVEFYERAFGWPRNERINYQNYVELLPPDGGALGLYNRDGYASEVGAEPANVAADGKVSPAYVYVRVEDVEATVATVEASGARLLSPLADRSWGERAAWFADPDGNVIAVAQSNPDSS